MSLLAFGKTAAGTDALLIDGHPVPVAAVAAAAGALGLVVVLRARSKGGNVASAGTAATTTVAGDPAGTAALSDAVSLLQNEIAQLAAQQPVAGASSGTAGPAPFAPMHWVVHPAGGGATYVLDAPPSGGWASLPSRSSFVTNPADPGRTDVYLSAPGTAAATPVAQATA
jgi:hypothetical protein